MFVGRENELAVLNRNFQRMLEGHGSIVFLTGEAGLGKTTLVHEWRSHLFGATVAGGNALRQHAPSTDHVFGEAACSIPIGNIDVGGLEALQPWIDVSEQLLREMPAFVGTHGRGKKKVKKFDMSKFLIDTAPSWVTMIPILGPSVGAALEILGAGYDQVYMHKKYHSDQGAVGAQNQQQVFQQYVNLLTRISEESPLVIFLDDLHWADISSVNLLFYLARQIKTKRILVIGTYRADYAVEASETSGHHILTVKNEILRYGAGDELVLGYLDATAIRQLLRARFPEYTVDDRFELWLRKISDGNALFVTQYVDTLVEDGRLDARGCFTDSYNDIAVPRSALAVVEERMRRLNEGTRELLSYATVEGVEFTAHVLGHLSERSPLALLHDLQRATTRGLIFERGESHLFTNRTTTAFAFSHALFHQALYDSLIGAQRAHLHRVCFALFKQEWDERLSGAPLPTALATGVLLHAEKCAAWETVADVATAAAEHFWKAFAEEEALEMIARTIAASAHLAFGANSKLGLLRHAEALYLRGQIDRLRGRYEHALHGFNEAATLFSRAEEDTRVVDCACARASVHFAGGSYDDAQHAAQSALHSAEALGYSAGSAAALNLIGSAFFARHAFTDAFACFRRSRALYGALGDRRGEATALNNTGAAHYQQGEADQALASYRMSLTISEELADRVGEATVLQNIGNIEWSRGANDDALEFYRRSLAIRQEIGDRAGEATALTNIGAVHYATGEYVKAQEFFTRGLEICEEIGDRAGIALALNNVGTVHRLNGDYEASRTALERAAALCDETGAEELKGEILCELALLEETESRNDTDEERDQSLRDAARHMNEGLAILERMKSEAAAKYRAAFEDMRLRNAS